MFGSEKNPPCTGQLNHLSFWILGRRRLWRNRGKTTELRRLRTAWNSSPSLNTSCGLVFFQAKTAATNTDRWSSSAALHQVALYFLRTVSKFPATEYTFTSLSLSLSFSLVSVSLSLVPSGKCIALMPLSLVASLYLDDGPEEFQFNVPLLSRLLRPTLFLFLFRIYQVAS